MPIRTRLTLASTVAMAALLALTGLLVYVRVGAAMDTATERQLERDSVRLVALVREAERANPPTSLILSDDPVAQVLTVDGVVLATTHLAGAAPLLPLTDLRATGAGPVSADGVLPGTDDPLRLLAINVPTADGAVVVVIGALLETQLDARDGLVIQLFLAGGLLLAVSALGSYVLARAALRPVEALRLQAARVGADRPGKRLLVPPARDEIARLATTLNIMLDRLEQAVMRERRFAADAGHELRTPLTNLRAELELALRRPRTAAELVATIGSAAEETERLVRLADDLLSLAHAGNGTRPLHRQHIRVDGLLADVVRRHRALADQLQRVIRTETEPPPTEIDGDPLRLEQALGNLVDNALRHGSGTVRLSARACGDYVEMHVSDDGPGIPEAFMPRAKEPFTQADSARSGSGAGLGLAIVDAVAQAHGGRLVLSHRDTGLDAWLEIPLTPVAPASSSQRLCSPAEVLTVTRTPALVSVAQTGEC